MELTEKELALFRAIQRGMDEPNCGWLHEIAPFDNDHVTAGVLSSLVKKKLVRSYEDDETAPGSPPAYWVEIAQ